MGARPPLPGRARQRCPFAVRLRAGGRTAAHPARSTGGRRAARRPVLLHDTGWKTVDPADILPAIVGRSGSAGQETIRRHETEGAAIAARILADVGYPARDTERIVAIIDGHDTRKDALDLDDAVVKDADKLWRLTPHGLRTVGAWFALDPGQTLRFVAARTYDRLLTEPARATGAALTVLAHTDLSVQRRGLNALIMS
jgi:hypothetical protein